MDLMYADLTVITNTACAGVYGPVITCSIICTTAPVRVSTCQVSSHPNVFQNFTSYIQNISFSTPTLTTGMITNYRCPTFVKYTSTHSSQWTLTKVRPHNDKLFYLSSMSSLNFQAFRMTIIISTGRVRFHDFTSHVFQGDSGGPLVYKEKDGKYTQVGIVSFVAAAGCELGYPAGFTRVNKFLCWIAKYTDINFCFCPRKW